MNLEDGIERYVLAQENVFQKAFKEIKSGKKQSHWMCSVFPQIRGLGITDFNMYYGIKDLREAEQYLNYPILGKRLIKISEALFFHQGKTALQIFGTPDERKLKSCMTLFSQIHNTNPVFQKVLDKYYHGFHDDKTLAVLISQKNND